MQKNVVREIRRRVFAWWKASHSGSLARGAGRSKKDAEQAAAEAALDSLAAS